MSIKNLKLKPIFFGLTLGTFVIAGCKNNKDNNINPVIEISENVENTEKNTEIDEIETKVEVEEELIEEKHELVLPEPLVREEINDPYDRSIYDKDMYVTQDVDFKENPNEDSESLYIIDKCQVVYGDYIDGDWACVSYGDQRGYINKDYVKLLDDEYIEIDISDQHLIYRKDGAVILESDFVSGNVKTKRNTRIGYFKIYGKRKNTYLRGPGYCSFVNYWMPFDGGIGLHDASWRDEFGGDIYLTNGSHGCVNLPHDAAEKIYENSVIGTKVLVHK